MKTAAHHARKSPHFAADIAQRIWAKRRASLLAAAAGGGHLLVDLASAAASGPPDGYCVATIAADGTGEINSIFIAESLRGRGIGDALMLRCLAWMDDHAVQSRKLDVAAGNEEVFGFYAQYGFFPMRTVLVQRCSMQRHGLVTPGFAGSYRRQKSAAARAVPFQLMCTMPALPRRLESEVQTSSPS